MLVRTTVCLLTIVLLLECNWPGQTVAETAADLGSSSSQPVAFWHFDEGSGNIAHDSSGEENHGSVHEARWVAGKSGYALEYDGVDDLVDIPNEVLPPDAFSVSLWFFPKAPFGSTERMELLSSRSVTIRNDERSRFGSNLAFTIAHASRYPTINPTFIPEPGKWHHVVATYDGSAMRLYLDCNLSATRSIDVEIKGKQDLSIGAYKWIKGANPFKGVIDEVAIFDRALTIDEIQALCDASAHPQLADSKENSPEEIVRVYWEAIMRGDYSGAWEVVCAQQKQGITEEQFTAHQKARIENSLLSIKSVKVNGVEHRPDYSLVDYSMELHPKGDQQYSNGTSRVIKRDGRWGLQLSSHFIKRAKKR